MTYDVSCVPFFWSDCTYCLNKKVLLRDRKRRAARIISCPWHVLSGGQGKGGRGTLSWSCPGGGRYPCPDPAWGVSCPGPAQREGREGDRVPLYWSCLRGGGTHVLVLPRGGVGIPMSWDLTVPPPLSLLQPGPGQGYPHPLPKPGPGQGYPSPTPGKDLELETGIPPLPPPQKRTWDQRPGKELGTRRYP